MRHKNPTFINLSKHEMTVLRQGLFRLHHETTSLQSEIIACIERGSVLASPPAQEDVASVSDRVNNVLTAYAQLTRRKGWLDAEE